MTDITEFEFMDPDRVDAVHAPANGTPFLLLKSLRQEEAVKSCGDDACEVCSEKAKLKAKQRNALDDSSFAVPGKRKLPINDAAHVRNALSRFDQTEGLTPEEKQTAMSRIRAAAKRFGVDVDDDKSEKAVPSQATGEALPLRAGSVDEQESQTRDVHAGRSYGAVSLDNDQDGGDVRGNAAYNQPRPSVQQGGGATAPNKSIPKSEALSQTAERVATERARASKGTTRDANQPSDSDGAGADAKTRADMSGDNGKDSGATAKGEAASQGKEREATETSRQKSGRTSQPDMPISKKAKKAKPIEGDNPDADDAKVAKRAKKALKRLKKLAPYLTAEKSVPLTAQYDIRQAAALLAGVTPRLDNLDKEFDDMTKEELIQLLDQREAARKEAKDEKKAKKAAKQEAKKAKKDEAKKAKKAEAKKAEAGASAETVEAPKGAEAVKSAEAGPDVAEIKKALGDLGQSLASIGAQVEQIAKQPARPMPILNGSVDLSRGQGDAKADPFAALKERFEKSTDPQEKAYLGGKLTEFRLKNMERRGPSAYPAADTSRLAVPQDEGRTWIPGAARR